MDRKKLNSYKRNKKRLVLIEKSIEDLQEQLRNVPEVSIKVQKSSDDFPYIEEHLTVKGEEPVQATKIKIKIRDKRREEQKIKSEISEVDEFIGCMKDGCIEKDIFEAVFLQGKSQQAVADEIGYTQGRVSQIINSCLKD